MALTAGAAATTNKPDTPHAPSSLARLQQGTTIGGLLLAAVWAVAWWLAGQRWWALAGALLIVGLYALVLAIEFVLLGLVHGDDPAPRATPRQLLRAWWGEVRSGPRVFCWQQPFRSQRFADHLPADATGRRGVLLVHGFVCNRGLWNSWLQRLRAAGVPVVAVNLEPVFGSIDDYAPIIDAAVLQLAQCTGRPPLAVAHSMGGLALRGWWALPGNSARIAHAVTLGTPHQGTWLARFALSRNARQMRRGSAWAQALSAGEAAAHGPTHAERLTCFYSHCDNIVFPASTATLPGADNRHLPGVAHVHMVEAPGPWQALRQLLQADMQR